MKKTITILLLAVFVAFSFTACGGGGGGGSGISGIINTITGKDDKSTKDNFAGKTFGDNSGRWGSGYTQFAFGAAGTGTVNVHLEGSDKGACTYNKPTGLTNVTLEIKDSGGTVIFNQVVNFDNEAHSFNTPKKTPANGNAIFSLAG